MTARPVQLIKIVLALVMVAVVLGPMLLMFATSFKADESEILRELGGFTAFWVDPSEISLDNYRQVLADEQSPFLRYMMNSGIIVFSVVVAGVFVNSLAAFALARLRFRLRNLVLAIVVALIIIPMEAVAVPLLLMVNEAGWLDTYQAQIIPFIAHPFSIFLFYQFFSRLPKELDEAAYVDGASSLRIYWTVALPLSLPAVATVAILQSLEYWNAFLWPLMVTRGPEVRPVSLALAQYFGTPPPLWGDMMAFSVMMSLPILIIYLAFQRWFIQSIVSSAVKG